MSKTYIYSPEVTPDAPYGTLRLKANYYKPFRPAGSHKESLEIYNDWVRAYESEQETIRKSIVSCSKELYEYWGLAKFSKQAAEKGNFMLDKDFIIKDVRKELHGGKLIEYISMAFPVEEITKKITNQIYSEEKLRNDSVAILKTENVNLKSKLEKAKEIIKLMNSGLILLDKILENTKVSQEYIDSIQKDLDEATKLVKENLI